MDFFGFGIPIGRYFGINVRVSYIFFIYAWWRLKDSRDPILGIVFLTAIFFCILLHEFGHALAARWCDGEANDILLWPLGGLAYVRPAFDPTAHLITTVAGPFVTLILWLLLKVTGLALMRLGSPGLGEFLFELGVFNQFILFFNLIPAFPMDGGRMLRDTLWHWMSAETATQIAINVSRFIALLGVICVFSPPDLWVNLAIDHGFPLGVASFLGGLSGQYFFLVFPLFIFMQTTHEQQIVAMESRGAYEFSIRERIRRGRKQRAFREALKESGQVQASAAFHKCSACGLTEVEAPKMDFRVCPECSNGQEYCREHLDAHTHV